MRFAEKDELGGNKLVLKATAEPGEQIEPWCVSTAEDGTVTIRGAAVDRLAELEDKEERERRNLWRRAARKETAGGLRTRDAYMRRQ